MAEIYKFNNLRKYLEGKGVRFGELAAYKIMPVEIKGINDKSVSIENDYLFYTDTNGNKRQVFMYKRQFLFKTDLGEPREPKAHLCFCETLARYGRSAYMVANDLPVEIEDKSDGYKKVKVEEMDICYNCLSILMQKSSEDLLHTVTNLEDAIRIMKDAYGDDSEGFSREVNINGYSRDWEKISKAYKKKQEYVCEICGFNGSEFEFKKFMDVHHKDMNKMNNTEENLQCLCVECHSKVNEIHIANFRTGIPKIRVERFKALVGHN